ncbi:MAG: hypothetical protein ABI114_06820 [Rhodanobacter sp.]
MRRLLSGVILIIAAAALSGCYYQPGYGYVRSTNSGGDAYTARRLLSITTVITVAITAVMAATVAMATAMRPA